MTVAARAPHRVVGYARQLATVMHTLSGADLIGLYLHGSAVLGGFSPPLSDVEVLAVVARAGSATHQFRVGTALGRTIDRCPGRGLDLTVVTTATARSLGTCPFEVRVTGATDGSAHVIPGTGHPGNPELVLQVEICRRYGLAVTGPPPDRVFAPVAAQRLRWAICRQLDWALAQGRQGEAVLNACRALRFAADGSLCAKVEAGRWYLSRHPHHPLVAEALVLHQIGDRRELSGAGARFVTDARALLAATDES
ncbi:aminoglycoside adenylyltransferase domain-containing protein [Micromonospora sp. NPDC050417]|uniref:aminoglycoside adenylyltransferase domain-containing protein n=1 Tax=Micromonospora sp. NPDC050417 TaxID=3364280 RepID=UPI003790EA6C